MSCCKKSRRRRHCEQGTTTININIGNSDDKLPTTKLNHNDNVNEKKIVLALEISNSNDNGFTVINTNGTHRIISKL